MTKKRTAGFAAFLAFLLNASAALAVDATISTMACEALGRNAPLQLSPADDSDLYLAVNGRLRDLLGKIGHPVQQGAALDMYYSLVETAVEVRGEGPTLGRLDVRTVSREAHAQLLVNLWSNQKDSILGGRRTESGVQVSNMLIVTLELNRQDNGRCVWRGEGAVPLGSVNARDIAAKLTEAVAARIGEAIEGVTQPLH